MHRPVYTGRHWLAAAALSGIAAVWLAGCASPGPIRAPVAGGAPAGGERTAAAAARATSPTIHRVRRGDTLYSIAFRYGHDYRDLARWNAIDAPYTIYPGQPLVLSSVGMEGRRALQPVSVRSPGPRPRPRRKGTPPAPVSAGRPPPAAAPAPRSVAPAPAGRVPAAPRTDSNAPVSAWNWPADGRLLRDFSATGRTGIDIAGRAGQDVVAAAAGRVVYAGIGLRGYGQLIILKHNNRYLSAYAHNKKLHVAEGDDVARGERIAQMGSSGTDRVMLHFEIRRDGKPVNPVSYLPRRPG